ncbi:unnamed protein product [Hydatigera taeniaeformis]|uniref:IRS-type PTB domain-containing protein n=1 Tax=Hydatigena taeniaeformis TaxID=6205 RepID=A0A0R3X839_HYDTA|nr:unnamed protein product [Hydatigera taeniaeformis]
MYIYHSLAVQELSARPHDLTIAPIHPRLYFHQLSRMIKAVIIATKRQRILYRSGGSLCSFMSPKPPRARRWICNNHATDIFRYMFYAADDDIYYLNLREVQSSRPAKWVGKVFPEGQTEFFRKGLSKFELATSVPRFRTSHTVPNFLPENCDLNPCSGLTFMLRTKDIGGHTCGRFLPRTDIKDANRRWNEGYKDVKLAKQVEISDKRVRFPKYCPVTRIYNLITYKTALNLLRKDRTWEFCSIDREREGRSEDDEDEVEMANETRAPACPEEEGSSERDEIHIQAENGLSRLLPETTVDRAGESVDISYEKHRRCFNESGQVKTSVNGAPSVKLDMSLGTSSSFRLDSYFGQVSSVYFEGVGSPPSRQSDTSSRVVDEFLL